MRELRLGIVAGCRSGLWLPLLLWVSGPCASAFAQPAEKLTLAEARQIALSRHPSLLSANLAAEAATAVAAQSSSAYWPVLTANLTSVGAQPNTAVASGAVTTSSLASRVAGGFVASQLITDFGRTTNLVRAARLRADAESRHVRDIRARVSMEVVQAFYGVLAAESVLTTMRADLENRQLLLRQVAALAASDLKSTLDVSFAEVAVSEAELGRDRAESGVEEARAQLSAALGDSDVRPYELMDDPLPPVLAADAETLIAQALVTRPDVAAARLRRDAALKAADAERALSFPAVSATLVAGAIPTHDGRLQDSYRGAGLNVSVPLFNGGLFAARRTESNLRAQAAAKDVEHATVLVARDVRVAWQQSTTAFKGLALTARLVEQATRSSRLASTRYELGLSDIVELNQAQLSSTSAQIAAATAKYEYLTNRAVLDYAVGTLE